MIIQCGPERSSEQCDVTVASGHEAEPVPSRWDRSRHVSPDRVLVFAQGRASVARQPEQAAVALLPLHEVDGLVAARLDRTTVARAAVARADVAVVAHLGRVGRVVAAQGDDARSALTGADAAVAQLTLGSLGEADAGEEQVRRYAPRRDAVDLEAAQGLRT